MRWSGRAGDRLVMAKRCVRPGAQRPVVGPTKTTSTALRPNRRRVKEGNATFQTPFDQLVVLPRIDIGLAELNPGKDYYAAG